MSAPVTKVHRRIARELHQFSGSIDADKWPTTEIATEIAAAEERGRMTGIKAVEDEVLPLVGWCTSDEIEQKLEDIRAFNKT